jgi:hypothetical protein
MKSKHLILNLLLVVTGMISLSLLSSPIALAGEKDKKETAKTVVGLHEIVAVLPENMHLSAKIDTGAHHSSLDAQNIEFFTRDNKEWVRFQITRANQKRIYIIERPLVRSARIKTRIGEGATKEPQSRPVVMMQVCFGDQIQEIEVNLTDRSHFKYPFLLGYSGIVQFNKLVDPSLHDTLPLTCSVPKE